MARIAMSLLAVPLIAALSGTLVEAGGWGVVTLQHVPDSLAAGRPFTFVYTMRQHGIRPVDGLDGRIEARKGTTRISANAHKLPQAGTYAATLTFPEPGTWTVDVVSGASLHGHTLSLGVQVVDRDEGRRQRSTAETGRRLFEGKGCVMCHAHTDFADYRPVNMLDLGKKRYTPEYITAFLTSVSARTNDPLVYGEMPNLELAQHEIESLAAFLSR